MENEIAKAFRERRFYTVTSMDDFDDAVEAFVCGGGQAEYKIKLVALGLPADVIRWLAAYPGRRVAVRERPDTSTIIEG